MDRLEQYIIDNRASFDAELPSKDSKALFMAKVEKKRKSSKVVKVFYATLSFAAAITAVLFGFSGHSDIKVERMYNKMTHCENEILEIVESTCPDEIDEVTNMLRAVIAEAIPLEEQLPQELESKERQRILDRYYNQKIDALERIKVHYMNIDKL